MRARRQRRACTHASVQDAKVKQRHHAVVVEIALVEAGGTPASELRLPSAGEFNADMETVMRLCSEHDTPVVGPPLGEDEARAFLKHKSGE